MSAEVLEKVDEATSAELFELLKVEEMISLVSELDPDDAADILSELSEEERAGLLESISPTESAEIKELMSYSEDSAGGIMDPVLIIVSENAAVAEAIRKNPHRGDRRGFLLRLRCEKDRVISRRSWSPRLLVCFCLFCSAE